MVPADVEERTQAIVGAADNDKWFAARKVAGHITARVHKLLETARHLPRSAEHREQLQLEYPRIGVPGGRNGGRPRERRVGVLMDDPLEGRWRVARGHARVFSRTSIGVATSASG